MRVAVLSLTRDRLEYTQHCFQTLHDFGGLEFDHYVFDQGSTDGTVEWLRDVYDPDFLALHPENIGISRATNKLLDWADENADYDVIVRMDNDCEVVTEGTLKACARFVDENRDWIISPRIEGLVHPPQTLEIVKFEEGETVLRKAVIGGIFLAAHGSLYKNFRYNEDNPVWGMDEVQVCEQRNCGYLRDYVANHYQTTRGQQAHFPDYFARRVSEGGPP